MNTEDKFQIVTAILIPIESYLKSEIERNKTKRNKYQYPSADFATLYRVDGAIEALDNTLRFVDRIKEILEKND